MTDSNVHHLSFLNEEEYTEEEVLRIARYCLLRHVELKTQDRVNTYTRATIYSTANKLGYKEVWQKVFSDDEKMSELFEFLK